MSNRPRENESGQPHEAAAPPAGTDRPAASEEVAEVAGPPTASSPQQPADLRIRPTRVSAAWAGVLASAVVLVLLLVFILQNGDRVQVNYLGASWQMPLGVALLFAAVGGALVVGIVGVARLTQLRWTARRHRKASTQPRRTSP